MADHNATGKKAKRGEELVQRTRAAVLNAMDAVEKRGRTLSEILAEALEDNPIKFMELASKLCPKDINVDATIDDQRQFTELERAARLDAILDKVRERRDRQLDSAGDVDSAARASDGSLLQ